MNLQENNLHVFDIDDTLFHTNAKVKVVDHHGKVVQKLSNSEFNDHKLLHPINRGGEAPIWRFGISSYICTAQTYMT